MVGVVDGMIAAIAGDPLPILPLEAPLPHGVVVHLVRGATGGPVGGLAHEVHAPLPYAATNLYLLQRALADAEAGKPLSYDEAHRRVADALDGIDRNNHLLGTLRRHVQQENTPASGPVPLHEAVREAVDLSCATRRGQVDMAADLAPLPAARSGRRCIHHGAAELVVADEGPGISPEVQARIFDAFFTTKPQGTGLGLSIVHRIVEAAGGRITVASTPGEGSTFIVRFPAA